jgi:hypothetical protein
LSQVPWNFGDGPVGVNRAHLFTVRDGSVPALTDTLSGSHGLWGYPRTPRWIRLYCLVFRFGGDDTDAEVGDQSLRGVFSRRLFLGDNLDADQIQASYHDGVLRPAIPMARAFRRRPTPRGRRANKVGS